MGFVSEWNYLQQESDIFNITLTCISFLVDNFGYHKFADEVLTGNRFIRTQDQLQFLDWIGETALKRESILQPTSRFFRAQIGCNFNQSPYEAIPYDKDRMTPCAEFVGPGRVNSAKRPVLYCTNDKKTAVAETRPWLGSWITIAEFDNAAPLRIVDCSISQTEWYHIRDQRELQIDEFEIMTWVEIDSALSTPVTTSDDVHLYIPTQILAEKFKSLGFDGLAFKSSVSTGLNYAFFEVNQLKYVSSHVVSVDEIKYQLVKYLSNG